MQHMQIVQCIDVGEVSSRSRDIDSKQSETLLYDERVVKESGDKEEKDKAGSLVGSGNPPAEMIGQHEHQGLIVTDSSQVKIDELPDSQREYEFELGINIQDQQPALCRGQTRQLQDVQKGFNEQQERRVSEELTFQKHQEEAQKLIKMSEKVQDPEALIIKNFSLQQMKPADIGQETRAGSSQDEFKSAAKLIKADMRVLDNQQRQHYIRQTLNSQENTQRRRLAQNMSAVKYDMNNQTIDRQSIQLRQQFTSLQQVHLETRPQTRGESYDQGKLIIPSKGVFNRKSNATHHFFNSRGQPFNPRMSQELELDSANAEFNNVEMIRTTGDYKQDDPELVISSKKTSKMYSKRKSNYTNSSMFHKRSQVSSTDFASTGLTYPNVPLKQKLNSKSRKTQSSHTNNPMGRVSVQQSRDHPLVSQFEMAQSYDKQYFDQKDNKPKTAQAKLRSTTRAATSMMMYNQENSSLVKLNSSRDQASQPLNQFRATHDVKVKPISIYDSLNKTQVNFPSKIEQQSTNYTSSQQNNGSLQQRAQSSAIIGKKRDSPADLMVRQIGKDLKKLKEDLLQDELEKDQRPKAINACEEQAQLEDDFDEAIQDINKLGRCFWRFSEVQPIFQTVMKKFNEIMEKRRRQMNFYVKQMQGQFDLIGSTIAAQRTHFEKINQHLIREEEFRQMVYRRENLEVMKLIQEYETLMAHQPPIERPKQGLVYSELLPDLEFIQSQLENAQLNIERLKVYNEEERPADLHIINDVKNERFDRQRKLQVNTAKRVLKRFWVDKSGRLDKGTMTDTDEIAVFKNYYADQIDAMMEREIEKEAITKKLLMKTQNQQHLMDMKDRKITDLSNILEIRNTSIEELEITKLVLLNEAKEKEREYGKMHIQMEEHKQSVNRREQQAMAYIKQIQDLKDSVRQHQKDFIVMEKGKNMAELALIKNEQDNGNSTKRLAGIQNELDESNQKIIDMRRQMQGLVEQGALAAKAATKREEQWAKKFEGSKKERSSVPRAPSPKHKKTTTNITKVQTLRKQGTRKNSEIPTPQPINEDLISNESQSITIESKFSKDNDIAKNVYGIVTKRKQSIFRKSILDSKGCKILDGRCSNCGSCLDLNTVEEHTPAKQMIKKFESLMLGRQRTLFGNIMKEVGQKVKRLENQQNAPSSNSGDYDRQHSYSPDFFRSMNSGIKIGKYTGSSMTPNNGQNSKNRQQMIYENYAEEQNNVHNLVDVKKKIMTSRPCEDPKMALLDHKIITVTREIGKDMNYRFALDSNQMETRKKEIQNRQFSRGGIHETDNISRKSRSNFNNIGVQINHFSDQYNDRKDSRQTDQHPMTIAQINNPNAHEINNSQFIHADGSKTISPAVEVSEIQSKSQGRSLRHLSDSVLPHYNIPTQNLLNQCDMAVQTDYQGEDVQVMFLRRLDQFLGMKAYRPVDPHGAPRLPSSAQDEKTYHLANAGNSRTDAYQMRWSYAKTQVKNVANVEKMRKFEPLRRQTLETRHRFENKSTSPERQYRNVSTDSPNRNNTTIVMKEGNSSVLRPHDQSLLLRNSDLDMQQEVVQDFQNTRFSVTGKEKGVQGSEPDENGYLTQLNHQFETREMQLANIIIEQQIDQLKNQDSTSADIQAAGEMVTRRE